MEIISHHHFPVVFPSFNFAKAVENPQSIFKAGLPPRADAGPPIFWDENKNRIAKSEDGIELLLHVPNFLKRENHVTEPLSHSG